jgi:hypothetical protein
MYKVYTLDMNEETPKYIIELREHIDNRIDRLTADIADVVAITSSAFTTVQKQFNSIENTMATKKDTDRILEHISSHEVRIKKLEKEVFA